MTNEEKIKNSIIKNVDVIATALKRGKDVEIRKSASGISVAEIDKKVILR